MLLRNELDPAVTAALGPRPPTVQDWYPLTSSTTGRYAGLQSCGFTFTGKPAASPDDLLTSNRARAKNKSQSELVVR